MAKILVVDDEVQAVNFLKEELKRWDHHVITARNGPEALALIDTEQPNLMLLDIRMPGQNGIEVLREAKAKDPELSVIMVTAVTEKNIAKAALESGADDYVTKPIDLDYLQTTILVELTTRMN